MTDKIKKLAISPAPHIRDNMSTEKMMWITVIALLFPSAGSIYFFGIKALLLIMTCVVSALVFEVICQKLRKINISVKDGSAVITGMILALVLPPAFPLWAAIIGTAFSICIVKHIFGGIGKNIFNPALMGRAFLTAAFPVLITTYTLNHRIIPGIYTPRVHEAETHADTGATPLSKIKFEDKKYENKELPGFLFGTKKGSAGETSGALILIGLMVLLVKKIIDWRLPVSYFGSVLVFSLVLWLLNPAVYINPVMVMLLGGILLGGTYMVTDPVTTPVTAKGKWIFGAGAGILTIVIRNWGGYPEGVMFSILLMNAVTPLINRYTKPRIYGT
ncbi:RnfABCDGE type electron transport complex subunit D [Elusimicrobiota bacterium]